MKSLCRRILTLVLAAVLTAAIVFIVPVRIATAAEKTYLESLTPADSYADTNNSTIGNLGRTYTAKGVSGNEYTHGLEVCIKRDSQQAAPGYVWAAYNIPDGTETFAAYLDLAEQSPNRQSFSVTVEIIADGTKVQSVTVGQDSQFPVSIKADMKNAKSVTIYFYDRASATNTTAFILGNAAFLPAGLTDTDIPASLSGTSDSSSATSSTSPSNPNNQPDESVSVTATDAEYNQLISAAVTCEDHKYVYVERNMSWETARVWSESMGGYLATITSQYENDFLADYLKVLGNKSAFFGLTDNGNRGSFVWLGSEPLSFINWAARQPVSDGSVTRYGRFESGSDEWSTAECGTQLNGFIIEWGEHEVITEQQRTADNAIIVIAGLGGSELVKTSGDVLWPAESGALSVLDLNAVKCDEDGRDTAGVFAQTDITSDGAGDMYKPLLDSLSTYSDDYAAVLYQWDWRMPCVQAAGGLDELIRENGWDKVILIGHNTGGIVGCYYMAQYGTGKVSKFISLGTPYLGSAKAAYMISEGQFWEGPAGAKGNLCADTANTPSLYSLLPSSDSGYIGLLSVTGDSMLRTFQKDELNQTLGTLGANSLLTVKTDAESLVDFYRSLAAGEICNAYFVASTGFATPEALAVNDSRDSLVKLFTTGSGDGLVTLNSATLSMGTVRAPFIVSGVDNAGLVSDKSALTLIDNLLNELGDTSDYAAGCERPVTRTVPDEVGYYEVTVSGDAAISVFSGSSTCSLDGSGFYASEGTGRCAYLLNDGNTRTICVEQPSTRIVITAQDDTTLTVTVRKHGDDSFARWGAVEVNTADVLEMTAEGSSLKFASAGETTQLEPDLLLVHDYSVSQPADKTEEPQEDESVTWADIAGAIMLTVAGLLCLVVVPYCAYAISKAEETVHRRAQRQRMQSHGSNLPPLF